MCWAPVIEPDPAVTTSARLARALTRRAIFILHVTALLSLAGFVGDWAHWLELSSHFRPQYLGVLVVGCVWLAILRRWRALAPLFVACLINAGSVLPWYLETQPSPPSDSEPLRLLLANVYTNNTDHEQLLALVERENPGVIVLQEVDDVWVTALSSIEDEYPHHLKVPRSDNFGIAVYSRLLMPDLRVQEFTRDLPSILGTIRHKGRAIQLYATHPLPPIGKEYFRVRNEQLANLAQAVTTSAIVLGDLNMTMWSPFATRFESTSGLRNVRRGFGILPTWRVGLGPLQIPLDHCLASREFYVSNVRRGPDIGSDHYPLIVDLLIPPGT